MKFRLKSEFFGTESDALRLALIQLIHSQNILIEGITIKNGLQCTIHLIYCEGVLFDERRS